MPERFYSIPKRRLYDIARLTGGAALLVAIALMVATHSPGLNSGTVAAVFCTTSPCQVAVGSGYIQATLGQVESGQSTMVSWSGPANAQSTTAPGCWGNGTTCGTAHQSISTSNSHEAASYAGSYLIVSNFNAPTHIYKWTASGTSCPSGGGLGNGTNSCATTHSTLQNGSHDNIGVNTVSDGASNYVLLTNYAASSKLFKWMSAQSCFGDGTTCATAYQVVNSSDPGDQSEHSELFTISGVKYLLIASNAGPAARLYRWTSSGNGCPTGGGWGNGTNCNNNVQTIGDTSWDAHHWEYFTPDGTNHYFAVAAENQQGRIYKWTVSGAGCTNGVGLGDGSTCGAANYLQAIGSGAWNINRWTAFSPDGSSTYLMVANGALDDSYMYKWMSGSQCLGNGTTCGTPIQNIAGIVGGTKALDVVSAGGFKYLFVSPLTINSRNFLWTTGATCPTGGGWGDGTNCGNDQRVYSNYSQFRTTHYTMGGNEYVLMSNQTSSSQIYRFIPGATTPACTVTRTTSGGSTQVSTATSGNVSTGVLTEDTTYTLTCNTTTGTVSDSITIDVYERPTVTIAFTQHGAEPSTSGRFTVTATPAPTTGPLTVLYDVTGGTATEGTDYTTLSGSVVIPQNQTTATIYVVPTDDTVYEGLAESVSLTLLSSPSSYTVGAQSTANLNINDNDSALSTVTINTTANAAESPTSNGTFTVTATPAPTAGPLTVNYTVTSGTATQGTDYNTLSGSVVIPQNQSSATITLTPVNDNFYEGNETAAVSLSTNPGYALGSPSSATVTISDSETAVTVPTLTNCVGAVQPPACTIAPTTPRVARGSTATLLWNVQGLTVGSGGGAGGNTCTITSLPSISPFPVSWVPSGSSWVASANPVITSETIFTLTCLSPNGSVSVSAQTRVRIIPTLEEI